jgi:hypothetical protein
MYTQPLNLLPLCLLALFEAHLTFAVKFPFHVHHSNTTNRLQRRADISGQTTGNTSVPVANSHNAIYISNITLGGQSVAVSLDTGRYFTKIYSLRWYLSWKQFRSLGCCWNTWYTRYRQVSILDIRRRQSYRYVFSLYITILAYIPYRQCTSCDSDLRRLYSQQPSILYVPILPSIHIQ